DIGPPIKTRWIKKLTGKGPNNQLWVRFLIWPALGAMAAAMTRVADHATHGALHPEDRLVAVPEKAVHLHWKNCSRKERAAVASRVVFPNVPADVHGGHSF